ncbi:C13 family peptidase [Fulvimonas soli]|uniref:Peptidase C13-like protein n=1 Tax=Fulvimonas soli TaxID=155197 RepID=A0A316IIE7_9GAMM|nr:C13 family peptidase [Fulvimonas soli]PWK92959.1 peptidase C13-like protein [Fulvimonas soli]TNY26561.1 peptidase C13 [Fulvimonas soli]
MRVALTALLAFAAGVLLMLALHPVAPRHAAASARPAVAASAPAPAPEEADEDEPDDAWPDDAPTPEQVIYAQPRLLKSALAHLTPRVPGRPNLYLLAFAGDGAEDVFRNEAEYATRLFVERFGPTAHALVLENNPATLDRRPLANWSNLEAALDALPATMDPAQDILVLYLTSHGGEDHSLLVDMDPLPLDQIGAQDLGDILRRRPFKWKVVVVNACYTGGFVPELRGPGTLVLTAARADRSSFGCGSDSDITYFGRAWLVDALNRTDDLIAAFRQAQGEIAQWERKDRFQPSEPQIDIGEGIADKLAQWRKGVPQGTAVPFAPASNN